jgi:hypothetical protein
LNLVNSNLQSVFKICTVETWILLFIKDIVCWDESGWKRPVIGLLNLFYCTLFLFHLRLQINSFQVFFNTIIDWTFAILNYIKGPLCTSPYNFVVKWKFLHVLTWNFTLDQKKFPFIREIKDNYFSSFLKKVYCIVFPSLIAPSLTKCCLEFCWIWFKCLSPI